MNTVATANHTENTYGISCGGGFSPFVLVWENEKEDPGGSLQEPSKGTADPGTSSGTGIPDTSDSNDMSSMLFYGALLVLSGVILLVLIKKRSLYQ